METEDAAPCRIPTLDLKLPILWNITLVLEYKFLKAFTML